MISDYDQSLQSYFTGREASRDLFDNFVSAESLPKRMIVFHGIGGIGKSSLLRMFRLHCKDKNIPVTLVSGDDAKSVLDIVTQWAEGLKQDGVRFPSLNKTLKSYRAIRARAERQIKSGHDRAAKIASQVATKAAESAGGAVAGAVVGTMIPGIGTAIGGALGGLLSSIGMAAFTDWLAGFLTEPDIDLLLDPSKKLAADFLQDVAKAARGRRLVLLLDTFEQFSALDDWLRETIQEIHPNVLLVIAGRDTPNWKRSGQDWMIHAQVVPLEPMTEAAMRELINRYYGTMRGGEPDPAQVEMIIHFAKGLPIVVTSSVQLWVKYGVEDFQSVKPEIVASLVECLMEGVPEELIPALEAAAVVRWFDQPILRAVMNKEDVRHDYNEVRVFPFVLSRVEGLVVHDTVREIMDENLRVQDSELHAELHRRAAAFFDAKLMAIREPVDEDWKLTYESVYHHVKADENEGLEIFKQVFEQAQVIRPISRHILLADLKTDSYFNLHKGDWIKYYEARVLDDVEQRIQAYQTLTGDPTLELHVRTSLGIALFNRGRMQQAIAEFEQNQFYFRPEMLHMLSPANQSMTTVSRRYLRSLYRITGRYLDSLELPMVGDNPRELAEVARSLYFLGRFEEAVRQYMQCNEIGLKIGTPPRYQIRAHRHLGHVYQSQGRDDLAKREFEWSKNEARRIGDTFQFEAARSNLALLEGDVTVLKDCVDSMRDMLKVFPGELTTVLRYLNDLAKLTIESGQLAKGCQVYQETLDLSRKSSYALGIMRSLLGLCHYGDLEDDKAISALLAEAEKLAEQYSYNDYLASVRLMQGYLAFESNGLDEALSRFQSAMIHALRFNRFLLDEVVSGPFRGTPIRPLIPYFLKQGERGREILFSLQAWWKAGSNEIRQEQPDPLSALPSGVPLLEAEKLAREQEPGNNLAQSSVIAQFETVLSS